MPINHPVLNRPLSPEVILESFKLSETDLTLYHQGTSESKRLIDNLQQHLSNIDLKVKAIITLTKEAVTQRLFRQGGKNRLNSLKEHSFKELNTFSTQAQEVYNSLLESSLYVKEESSEVNNLLTYYTQKLNEHSEHSRTANDDSTETLLPDDIQLLTQIIDNYNALNNHLSAENHAIQQALNNFRTKLITFQNCADVDLHFLLLNALMHISLLVVQLYYYC